MSNQFKLQEGEPTKCKCGSRLFTQNDDDAWRCILCQTTDASMFTFAQPAADVPVVEFTEDKEESPAEEQEERSYPPKKRNIKGPKPVEGKTSSKGKVAFISDLLQGGAKLSKSDILSKMEDEYGINPKMKATISAQLTQKRIGKYSGLVLQSEPIEGTPNQKRYWLEAAQ